MIVAQTSLIFRFFAALGLLLGSAWQGSAPGRLFGSLGRGMEKTARGSRICCLVWREGTLPKSWPISATCRVLTVVFNVPCALARWLYQAGKGMWDGSVAFRVVSAVGGSSFVLLGLMLLVMLIAPHALWKNPYALLGAVAITGLFVVGSGARPRHRLEVGKLGPYPILYFGFICYGLVASLSVRASLRFFGFYVAAFLITLLIVSSVRRYEQLQLVVVLAVAGITVASLYGCVQGFQGVEIVASQQDMIVNAGMPGRVNSFFDNPNNFAELLAMLIPLLMALFLNAKTWRGKLLAVCAAVPCVAAIGFTYSRSSWIGLMLAVLVFLGLQNWRLIPLLLVLGLVAIPFLPESIYNRILSIGNKNDSSTRYRFAIYDATANLMQDYKIRGVGLGSDVMKAVFHSYPTMFDGNYPIHTHNNYLQMWGELGIFGAISYLAMVAAQLKTGVKTFYTTTSREIRNLLSAALGGFCGILVIGVAEYTWFYARNMFLWWFLFGIITCCIKLARSKKER